VLAEFLFPVALCCELLVRVKRLKENVIGKRKASAESLRGLRREYSRPAFEGSRIVKTKATTDSGCCLLDLHFF
jgi:hypothetical protein